MRDAEEFDTAVDDEELEVIIKDWLEFKLIRDNIDGPARFVNIRRANISSVEQIGLGVTEITLLNGKAFRVDADYEEVMREV